MSELEFTDGRAGCQLLHHPGREQSNFTCSASHIRRTIGTLVNLPSPVNGGGCLPDNQQYLSPKGKQKMSANKPGDNKGEPMEQRLRSLIAEHEAKLTEIADLVAHVRHEINNPLTGVLGQAQLLLREELSPRVRQRVETIEQLATRIKDTVAQLRDVQRPHKKGGGRKDE